MTCIRNPSNTKTNWNQDQYQYITSYFIWTNGKLGKIGDKIRNFLDVEHISEKVGTKMMSPEDKMALKIVEKTIKWRSMAWSSHWPLLNNNSDAEKKLHHIEKSTLQ